MADQLFEAKKVVDDDPMGCYNILSQTKEWPQRMKDVQKKIFTPIYHIYKGTKVLC